tara:strand:- start:253 stop:465 length:213 start_codon:yes stop_codon:yes gene_type:complete
MDNEIELIDLESMTFYFKLGEYPDLDSASVRSAKYKDGTILTKEDKIRFKDEYPESFYQLLWDFIGQYGK